MLKVNTKLAQVPDYPEDADEPVINTSNAADRPIAWFILGQRVPAGRMRSLRQQHPELKPDFDWPIRPAAGLQMLRLRSWRQGPRAVKANWLPPEEDVTKLRKFAEDFIEVGLERVEGVSNSNVLGGREEELQVVIDPRSWRPAA